MASTSANDSSHHVVQPLAEQRARAMDARGVHEHDLRMIGGQDATL